MLIYKYQLDDLAYNSLRTVYYELRYCTDFVFQQPRAGRVFESNCASEKYKYYFRDVYTSW